jgi:predicted nucleic-acid-binding Zn-ribbon protein
MSFQKHQNEIEMARPKVSGKGWFKDKLEEDECIACAKCGKFSVEGEAVFATGETLAHGYTPYEGEILKFLWMECTQCGWNQES